MADDFIEKQAPHFLKEKHKNVSFTWHNYTESDWEFLKTVESWDWINVLFVKKEIGEKSGKKHLQGYLECNSCNNSLLQIAKRLEKTRYDAAKKKNEFVFNVFLKPAEKQKYKNGSYVHKKDTADLTNPEDYYISFDRYFEPEPEIEEEEKTEPKEAPRHWERVISHLEKNEYDELEFVKLFPGVAVRNLDNIRKIANKFDEERQDSAFADYVFSRMPKLLTWQNDLHDEIQLMINYIEDRKIIWYFDDGNTGKSAFARWLLATFGKKDVAYFGNGKTQDIVFGYEGQKLVIFNFEKSTDPEAINYIVIEKLKDGLCYSNKYGSRTKVSIPPVVIVFANCPPVLKGVTKDRWDVRMLSRKSENHEPHVTRLDTKDVIAKIAAPPIIGLPICKPDNIKQV